MLLRTRYAMCGTKLVYAANVCVHSVWGAMRCAGRGRRGEAGTVLRDAYVMSGTHIAFAATQLGTDMTRCPVMTYAMLLPDAEGQREGERGLCCYAMWGTVLAYGATRCAGVAWLRQWYVWARYVPYWPSVCCYGISRTIIAYDATLYPVLAWRMMLCDVRDWHSVWCYGTSRTNLPYAAMYVRYCACVWCYTPSLLTSRMLLPVSRG
eukprot:950863-Rhodomonas_salina.1